jgi:hypothetical protein
MSARGFGLALLVLSAAALGLAAGDETAHEQALKQTIGAIDKMTMTLSTIKDEETAQAAKPELQKAVKVWTMVKAKAAELPPPEQAEKDRLAKAYKPKLDTAVKKFFTEVARVRKFPAGNEVLKEIKDIKGIVGPK